VCGSCAIHLTECCCALFIFYIFIYIFYIFIYIYFLLPLQEALGALATAIKCFDGGVLLISHNSAFTSTCCSETWKVEAGTVTVSKEAPPGGTE
jgi:hypothetical protein